MTSAKNVRLKNCVVLRHFTLCAGVWLLSQSNIVTTVEDLAATIALQGKPCGKVMKTTKPGENDYHAPCVTGDIYRVHIDDRGRVIAKTQ